MSIGGMSAGGLYRSQVKWRDVPGIYKARFRKLWQVLRLSLLATAVAFATVVLIPLFFGIAFFSGHVILTAIIVSVALLISGWLFWESLKLAFNIRDRR